MSEATAPWVIKEALKAAAACTYDVRGNDNRTTRRAETIQAISSPRLTPIYTASDHAMQQEQYNKMRTRGLVL